MHAWLKRAVAGLLSAGTLLGGGLLTAGTANADEIRMPDIGKTITSLTASAATTYPRELVNGGFDYLPADASTLPDHLINGDFEYPTADIMGKSDGRFWYISQNDNSWWANVKLTGKEKRSTLPAGFDKSKFAWHSTQTGNTHYPTLERADDIQVDYKGDGTNHYSEITAAQAGSTLYQDVATTPGVMYRWSLKHASINSANIDRMSVMIGEPGKETAQEATRTTVNGNGDKTGKVGTEIATKVSNSASDGWNRVGQWETYTGTYIATSTVTRFAFRSIEGGGKTQGEAWDGNLLDDVQFTKAYKLSYDKNASDASGSVPSNGSADTTQPASTSGESGVKTAADTSDDANKVVNGDFEFPKWSQYDPKAGGSEALPWMYLDTQTGKAKTYWQAMAGNSGKTIKGLNTTTFPWVDLDHPGQFEIHREKNGNLYADVHKDRTVGQVLQTEPNTSYTVSIRHSARSKTRAGHENSEPGAITMLAGPDKDHLTAIELTRTTLSETGRKAGQKLGPAGTTVTSPDDSVDGTTDHAGWDHTNGWETYTGTYIVPAGQTSTLFAYRGSVDDSCIDDLSFTKAYPLSYDKNAQDASGSVPSRTKANGTETAAATGTGSVKTAADTTTNKLPDHLVNGDFEYPSMKSLQHYFAGIDRNRSQWISNGQGGDFAKWSDIPGGLDTTRFGWSSTQTQGAMSEQRANAVELQKATGETTQMGELCASQKGTAIYQDIATTPGTLYRIELDHASRYSIHLDQMQVMVGAPGHEQPVEMTRTSSNKYGDKIGEKSTTIATHSTNPFGNQSSKDDFSHYVGYYTIPAGQSVTRFTFRQVSGVNTTSGNLLDNIVFTQAYKLDYDRNSDEATGQTPNDTATVKPAKTSATGGVKPAVDDTNNLPDHLVNGDFSVNYKDQWLTGGWNWTSITPDGKYLNSVRNWNDSATTWKTVNGWDKTKFGWSSTQKDGTDNIQHKAGATEIQYDDQADNVYAELCAYEKGTAIYQDIKTVPGTLYKVRLRHASLNQNYLDKMQVLIGAPGHETPVEMTRTTVNGHGDKLNEKSTTIATKVTNNNDRHHESQWETYEGTYLIPAGQATTRFTFKSIDAKQLDYGNLLDDIVFDKAYRLTYDKNASDASGQVPSNERGRENTVQPAKSKTTGSVRLAADKTASGLTVHDLKNGEIAPVQYGDFKFSTTDGFTADQITDVNGFDVKTNWDPTEENQAYAGKILSTMYQPNKNGANLILHHVGQWRDSSGTQRWLNAKITVNGQNLGSLVYLESKHEFRASYGKWDLHPSSRPYMDVTVDFLLDDGSTPQGLRGATGFTDIDGGTSGYNEGVELVSGFDGAYVRSDAHLARFGTNGWAGITDENKNNADAHGMKHYVGATFTGSSFRVRWSVASGQARQSGFQPVDSTIAYRLTYDKNAQDATGSIPSDTAANTTQPAKSETDGKVSDLVQRTTTHEDGSVTVKTIDTSTDVVSGCQVYYPAGTRITLATAKADSDCWDSSQIGRPNRTFYGWSANTDANDRDVPVGDTMDRNTLNANVRTEIVMPARAKTVYALWAINPTLSYNVNAPAGSNAPGTPASQTVPYNTAAADKSGWAAGDTGKIPGYRFDGWYTAPNGGNKYDFNTPLTGNVTVYAHWVGNGYTVRFAGNGATGGGTPDQAFQYNIGQNLRRNGFTRDGYTFTGWKRADNQQAYGDGQWVTNLTTQPNGIVTMVAQWSANEAHIRYNPNPPAGKTAGGNGTPNWDGHTGDTPAIRGNGWTIDGYTFAGWTTNSDGGGTKYAPGASWTANGTLTLYAQWTPGEAGLTYDGNGATGGKTDPQNGVTDQKVDVRQNGFTRPGYTFVRWDTQADCRGKAVNPGDKWTLQGSSTLYACWTGNMQPLTYHGNGATGGNTAAQSGKTGDELTTNANGFTRDGYTFVRWDTAKDGSGTAYGEGKNGVSQYVMKPAGNDLYAIWKANPASIQYRDDYGATGSTPDTTGVTGQNVTIAQNGFTRPGYTFTGWARDRRTNPSLQPGGRYTLTPGTTTLWAQWKADPAHLIYNANTGSTSQTRRTDGVVDQTLTVIANPFTRSGYTFTGWNTQADGRGKAYTAGNGFRLVADAKSNPVNTSVLYAQWRINRVTLKFNPNGGTGGYPDITADAFTTVTIPADAKEPKVQRPGFRFTGWAMKPTPGNGDTILSPGKGTVAMPDQGSITVYAQWAPAMTTLPFTGGHAQVPTIGLYAGLAFMILAMGALMPVIRLRMGAGSKGRHAGTPTIGRHSR